MRQFPHLDYSVVKPGAVGHHYRKSSILMGALLSHRGALRIWFGAVRSCSFFIYSAGKTGRFTFGA